jgi:hypothetical protein
MSWGIAFRLRQQLKGSMWFLPFLAAVAGPLVGQVTLSFSLLRHVEDDAVPNVGVTVAGVAVAASLLLLLLYLDRFTHRLRPVAVAALSKLDVSVAESFPTDADRALAGESDRQGIGGPARVRPRSG